MHKAIYYDMLNYFKTSSRFSSNSEANASELINKNCLHITKCILNIFESSTTQ